MNILGFAGHRSLQHYSLCHCSLKAAVSTTIPLTLYLWKKTVGQVGPMSNSLPTPRLHDKSFKRKKTKLLVFETICHPSLHSCPIYIAGAGWVLVSSLSGTPGDYSWFVTKEPFGGGHLSASPGWASRVGQDTEVGDQGVQRHRHQPWGLRTGTDFRDKSSQPCD